MGRTINKFVVHCAATKPSMDIGVEQIRDWHKNGRGWSDIGYHWVIRRDGTVEPGRNEATPGAHVRGHNQDSIGICLVGGLNEDTLAPENNFTARQFDSLKVLIEALWQRHPRAGVFGHNEFNPNKACPCFDVGDWLSTWVSEAASLS